MISSYDIIDFSEPTYKLIHEKAIIAADDVQLKVQCELVFSDALSHNKFNINGNYKIVISDYCDDDPLQEYNLQTYLNLCKVFDTDGLYKIPGDDSDEDFYTADACERRLRQFSKKISIYWKSNDANNF